ncbi:MAG: NAD-dependent epimerase/dehydratase family protein [Nanoarchaeota archaeon]|nr:NAD-dependent epimerase/dehydratase family protein [Nanoarchaeota archaeon]
MNFFRDKKVLVTGGTGLIGRPLVRMLVEGGANVRIVSLDDPERAHPQAEFLRLDLTKFDNCLKACEGQDIVFHLAGIKGSPKMAKEKPASFFVPTILFNTNMMEAARLSDAEWFLYTSTVGVYAPAEVFHEDDVWKTFPSENDKFAGWAKRMGELQAEAYRIQYGKNNISIIRPANVYGPYDNFDPENAMVIPSLIKRAMDGENPLVVWGDGTPIRDFIHAEDVARGMMLTVEKKFSKPINLGSGKGCSIKEIVSIIVENMERKPEIVWDTSKPSGDKKRLMDIERARSIGFEPNISIEEGIRGTMRWYAEHKEIIGKRYNVFRENK